MYAPLTLGLGVRDLGVEKENAHKLFVVLRNGDRVPVSRKYRADLEARGVIRTMGTDVIFTS